MESHSASVCFLKLVVCVRLEDSEDQHGGLGHGGEGYYSKGPGVTGLFIDLLLLLLRFVIFIS